MAKITYDNKVNYTDGSSDNQYFQVEDANEIKSVVNGNDDLFLAFKNLFRLNTLTLYGKSTQSGTPSPTSPKIITNISGDQTIQISTTQSLIISLGLTENYICSVGDTQDRVVVNCRTGEISKISLLKKLVLNGSESWRRENTGTSGAYRFSLDINDSIASDTSNVNSMNSHFPLLSAGGTYSTSIGYTIGNNKRFYVRYASINTLEDFTDWLSSNNMTLIYKTDKITKSALGYLAPEDLEMLESLTLTSVDNITYSESDITKTLLVLK